MESIVGKTVKDISAYSFKDMEIGDIFKTRGILSGVDITPLEWRLIETNFSKSDLIFEVTYNGINVGEYGINPADRCMVSAL